jgi:hypothetical protein
VSEHDRIDGDRDPPAREVWTFALAWFGMALAAAVFAPRPLWKVGGTVVFLALGVITVQGAGNGPEADAEDRAGNG